VIDPDALNVWSEERLVGYLWQNRVGHIGFRYDPDWIATGGFAVSREYKSNKPTFSLSTSIRGDTGPVFLSPDLRCCQGSGPIEFNV
jgi:hypothetical protein